MNFYIDDGMINTSTVVLNKDNSFKTINGDSWDFQISIEPYTIMLLNFNYNLKECVGVEGYLNLSKIKNKSLNLIVLNKGILKVDNFSVDKGAFGTNYRLNPLKRYYDKEAEMLAIGDIEDGNKVFEFGEGQFVKLKEGQIRGLFVKFSFRGSI